jgi:hypothetical protein
LGCGEVARTGISAGDCEVSAPAGHAAVLQAADLPHEPVASQTEGVGNAACRAHVQPLVAGATSALQHVSPATKACRDKQPDTCHPHKRRRAVDCDTVGAVGEDIPPLPSNASGSRDASATLDCLLSAVAAQTAGSSGVTSQSLKAITVVPPASLKSQPPGKPPVPVKCYPYGNYHGYYKYRHATLEGVFQDDPRLQRLAPEWFAGKVRWKPCGT